MFALMDLRGARLAARNVSAVGSFTIIESRDYVARLGLAHLYVVAGGHEVKGRVDRRARHRHEETGPCVAVVAILAESQRNHGVEGLVGVRSISNLRERSRADGVYFRDDTYAKRAEYAVSLHRRSS